ncbi:hypothetical protein [Porticoccus sp.]
MRLRSPNILLVCLLALTTLWLSETAASHIHLDNDRVGCEICHSANGDDAALESRPAAIDLLPVAAVSLFTLVAAPVRNTAAPRNSRAPPSPI